MRALWETLKPHSENSLLLIQIRFWCLLIVSLLSYSIFNDSLKMHIHVLCSAQWIFLACGILFSFLNVALLFFVKMECCLFGVFFLNMQIVILKMFNNYYFNQVQIRILHNMQNSMKREKFSWALFLFAFIGLQLLKDLIFFLLFFFAIRNLGTAEYQTMFCV